MKKSYIFLVLLLSYFVSNAEVKLPAIVSSNMVLQRDTEVMIWGWASPKEAIKIKASWLDQSIDITADKEGNWKTSIKTTLSKEEQSIHLSSKSSDIHLENILFGEVWLCSGQSNMEMALKGNPGQPIFGSVKAIAHSRNPQIRLFGIQKNGASTPLADVGKPSKWVEASPETVADFSALAYFFGRELNEVLDVPVGLIKTSFGASFVEAWISKDVLEQYQKVKENTEGLRPNKTQTALFNAMVHPIIPYTIKGAIWYQGESNREFPKEYQTLFPAMVKDWRTRWNQGDFPFFFAQIAPYQGKDEGDYYNSPRNAAFLREAQSKCVDLIPNSYMINNMDLGQEKSIHPPFKKETAHRFVMSALQHTYNYEYVNADAPIFESMEQTKAGVLLCFKQLGLGLYCEGDIPGFEVAGKDKVFYPAQAKVHKKSKVIVTCDQVDEVVAVRYCWKNWIKAKLYGVNMIPVASFRTDDWEMAEQAQ
ncbi:sialate O-acetylesterase [Flammeovirga yaeyamensis]|uniref:Sialate O-acetylesterase n=1 Tax=Flammeovirga yaeyamensis TaxID=367791 RepID=A0AAX1NG37_9BACT|nr:sialate O-acetylesterase [Flammeovirga yaeyamensis]MBB3696575.1 sialate O-acetylesterase [Flammeovirga yaeyamensis]NMF33253.1 sialate O-acetylesterase [Flammeovirga yaeyamensis]QWG05468.1 sialate O-acetylesterase [Flammeovirga yaeyamensis]